MYYYSMLTIIVSLIILSILVIVHEFGHFIVGKFHGIGVKEFALGLPFTRPLLSKKLKDGMKLSIYPMLFGGFVSLLGEEGEDSKINKSIKGKYFYQANVWQRISVVVAGVIMNFILAVVVFFLFLGMSNFKVLIPKLASYNFISPSSETIAVSFVMNPSPAYSAGLTPGDIILTVDDKKFNKISEFQAYTKEIASRGGSMRLNISDVFLQKTRTLLLTPRRDPPKDQGPLGVGISSVIILNYETLNQKALSGLTYSVDMLGYNVKVISTFVSSAAKTGDVTPLSESVSGPVGIASLVSDILTLPLQQMVLSLLNLMALLSLSLAFINILPIPAMDGGRLLFLLIEAITTKKLPQKYENLINQIGMVLLLGLILVISFNDVSRIILPLLQR